MSLKEKAIAAYGLWRCRNLCDDCYREGTTPEVWCDACLLKWNKRAAEIRQLERMYGSSNGDFE